MSKKTAERYFVLNFFQGKGDHQRVNVFEEPSHHLATVLAYSLCQQMIEDSGEIPEQVEVFVGSRKALLAFLENDSIREDSFQRRLLVEPDPKL